MKKKKISILSMQRVINYGSVLQAYSLKNIVESIGDYCVDFIDIDRTEKIDIINQIDNHSDYKEKHNSSGIRSFITKMKHSYKKRLYEHKIKKFQSKILKLNNTNNKKMYDITIIGSDEVFIANKYIVLQLYGKVLNAKKVISYAASAGMSEYDNIWPKDISKVKDALNNISEMSVRDEHTKEYISKMYNGKINMNLDPVLVGNLKNIKHKKVHLKNYIVIYAYSERINDKREIEEIKRFASERNLKIVSIGGVQSWVDTFLPVSPFRMLDYFYYAEYIITDTFHGSIFSIINNKKFGVLKRKSNIHKINSLLHDLGLDDRLIKNIDELDQVLEKEIDYNNVDKILDEESKRTIKYLENSLK